MWKKLTTTNSLVMIIAAVLILFVIDQYMNKNLFGLWPKKTVTPPPTDTPKAA